MFVPPLDSANKIQLQLQLQPISTSLTLRHADCHHVFQVTTWFSSYERLRLLFVACHFVQFVLHVCLACLACLSCMLSFVYCTHVFWLVWGVYQEVGCASRPFVNILRRRIDIASFREHLAETDWHHAFDITFSTQCNRSVKTRGTRAPEDLPLAAGVWAEAPACAAGEAGLWLV